MSFAWLRTTLVTTLSLLPASALAATTGTGSSDSGGMDTDGGTTDTGTGTDSGTDSGSSSGGSSSGEVCTECTDSNDPVQILSPAEGAVVTSPFEVHVTAPYTCYCDTCGCSAEDPFNLTLRANNSTIDSCTQRECTTSDHTFTVELEPGEYDLDAAADHDLAVEFSTKVHITVQASGGDTTGSPTTGASMGNTTAPPPSDDSGTTGEAAADGGGSTGGCGCRSAGPSGPLASVLGLLLLGGLRRRRG